VRFSGLMSMQDCKFTNGEREVADVACYFNNTDFLFTDDNIDVRLDTCTKMPLATLASWKNAPQNRLPSLEDEWIRRKRQVQFSCWACMPALTSSMHHRMCNGCNVCEHRSTFRRFSRSCWVFGVRSRFSCSASYLVNVINRTLRV
jgi:hypothetical protein